MITKAYNKDLYYFISLLGTIATYVVTYVESIHHTFIKNVY